MTARGEKKASPGKDRDATAKLFMHGRTQAVRLPKGFRLPGTEVRVSKVGDKVIFEPLEPMPFDVKAWNEALDSFQDIAFSDVPEDPPLESDETISFDRAGRCSAWIPMSESES